MFEGWLRCDVLKGMFTSERAIRYPAGGTQKASVTSVFVPKESVRGAIDGEGRVRVRVFADEAQHTWAVLPDEVQTLIAVLDRSDLAAT